MRYIASRRLGVLWITGRNEEGEAVERPATEVEADLWRQHEDFVAECLTVAREFTDLIVNGKTILEKLLELV